MDLDDYREVSRELTNRILKKVSVYKDTVEIEIDHTLPNVDCNRLNDNGDTVTQQGQHTHVRISATLHRHSRKLALVNSAGDSLTAIKESDPVLIKNLILAHKWRESLESGEYATLQQIADVKKCSERFIRKIIPMAYLAPAIIESILEGRQPASFDLKKFQENRLPLSWQEQRRLLGYTA